MGPYTLSFDEVGGTRLPEVGGKGANLGELTRAGFPVPPGFCVTTAAYRDFVREGDWDVVVCHGQRVWSTDYLHDIAHRSISETQRAERQLLLKRLDDAFGRTRIDQMLDVVERHGRLAFGAKSQRPQNASC